MCNIKLESGRRLKVRSGWFLVREYRNKFWCDGSRNVILILQFRNCNKNHRKRTVAKKEHEKGTRYLKLNFSVWIKNINGLRSSSIFVARDVVLRKHAEPHFFHSPGPPRPLCVKLWPLQYLQKRRYPCSALAR